LVLFCRKARSLRRSPQTNASKPAKINTLPWRDSEGERFYVVPGEQEAELGWVEDGSEGTRDEEAGSIDDERFVKILVVAVALALAQLRRDHFHLYEVEGRPGHWTRRDLLVVLVIHVALRRAKQGAQNERAKRM